MGAKTRQQRREKAKQRAEQARLRREEPGVGPGRVQIRDALWDLCGWRRAEGMSAWNTIHEADVAPLCDETEALTEQLVARAWTCGWQPSELVRHGRRKDQRVGRVIAAATVRDHRRRDAQTVHPSWAAQVDDIAATLADAAPGWFRDLVATELAQGVPAVHVAMDVCLLFRSLRTLPTILPPPGSDPDTWAPNVNDAPAADDPILAKVRALLAQAESTTFEAEAETFMAKAQELIARHAIDTALLWSRSTKSTRPVSIRIPVDDPYADQKSLLLHIVAESSQCRAVLHTAYGLVSVVGFASDVAACEMLYTSLLVQSQAAMQAEAATATAGAHVRSRGFRSAFLQAYAHRIGDRLEEINAAVQQTVTAERAALAAAEPPLLPVLVERKEAVDAEIDELFGELTKVPSRRQFDALGWARGDAAGERAELNPAVAASRAQPAQRRELAS